MQTRILNTHIHRDSSFRRLPEKDKYIVVYLLTNEYLECIPAVEIGLDLLAFNCGTTEQYLKDKIETFSDFEIWYKDGYLVTGGKFAYTNYKGGKTKGKKEKLINALPIDIRKYIDDDGDIEQTLLNDCSMIEHINHKSKTLNHKPENIKEKTNKKEKEETQQVIDKYNEIMKKNVKSAKGFAENYLKWRKEYSLEDILKAIECIPLDEFWHDKMKLAILFRQKNPRGEPVDYIGALLEQAPEQAVEIDYSNKI
jgi:hypothetical protein